MASHPAEDKNKSIIHHTNPPFLWIATVIEVFIIISIPVSVMRIGTAMHPFVCGIVESNFPVRFSPLESKRKVNIAKKCTSSFLSLILFGIVFIAEILNPKQSMNTVYLQTYFVTIACVLGTGILGLPVTLYRCGFYPFAVLFMFAFVMQAFIIFIGVEILQKSHAIQVKYLKENEKTANDIEDPSSDSSGKTSETNSSATQTDAESETKSLNLKKDVVNEELEDQSENKGPVILSKQNAIRPPDLHFLGEMFLGYGFKHVFDFLIIFEVVTLLIAFTLAGSEAYGEILGIKHLYIIPVFTWCLALIVLFAASLIQPVVSILTLFKATLFLLAVIVTFFVTSEMRANAENNFIYIQDSLLMTIVTLGGSFLVMPYLFSKIENDVSQVLKYRLAVVMGLVTCTVLNLLWCWVVFDIVPQHCPSRVGTNQSSHAPVVCNSLKSAKENGEISTVPLTKIIRHKDPYFIWVATVVEVFIIISITVSFLTVGTVMHHSICGIIESNFPSCFSSLESKSKVNIAKKCTSGGISFILFGIIFVIAMLNPKGFLDVMEKFTSIAVNVMNILVFMMFVSTRNKENNEEKINQPSILVRVNAFLVTFLKLPQSVLFMAIGEKEKNKVQQKKVKIPLPLPNVTVPFFYVLPIYFGLAVVYDIYISVKVYLPH